MVQRRVWALVAGVGIAAAVSSVYVLGLDDAADFGTGWLQWAAFTVAFALAEGEVIRLSIGRENHTLSFNEIPLVLGLFYLRPSHLVLALVVGSVAALVFQHDQHRQPVKLAVNSVSFWLGGNLAAISFHAILGRDLFVGPVGWLAAIVAATLAAATNFTVITSAIALSESYLDRSRLLPFSAGLLVQTVTASSLALIAVVLVRADPAAVALMVVPIVGVYVAFRAYSIERDRHQSLEVLYGSVRILQEAPEVGKALSALLGELRSSFNSEVAEVTLLASESGDRLLRTTVTGDEQASLETVAGNRAEWPLVALIASGRRAIVRDDEESEPELTAYLRQRRLRDAMLVPLHGGEGTVGVLMVANRVGQVSPYRPQELDLLETLADNASVSLRGSQAEHTLAELHALKEELAHQAFHDRLTGLANRDLFASRVEDVIAAAGEDLATAILSIDIDDFKGINETVATEGGDVVLTEVAERLRRCAPPGSVIARFGADEFGVLVPGVADPQLPRRLAERIAFAMRLPVHAAGHELRIRLSIGVAVGTGTDDPDVLIRNAGLAKYHAKRDPATRYAVYDREMGATVIARQALRADLLAGVDSEQFVVYFQPLVDLATGTVTGFEALVRWEHPERGLVGPDEFISLAEETGLVVPIGEIVLMQAATQLARWQRDRADLEMSVNLSAAQLRHESIVTTITRALETSGVRPDSLVLEITERDVMDDTEASQARLRALKDLGVRLAIDDFGTGYSSLAYLHRFPFDVLKIAKPFVDALETGGRDATLAHAIIEMCRTLGLDTVAEGVETSGQRDQLMDWGCRTGQGWLFAPALPAADAERHLTTSPPFAAVPHAKPQS